MAFWLYLAAALAVLGFWLHLLWGAPPTPAKKGLALVSSNIFLWQACELLVLTATEPETALLLIRATYAALIVLPVSFFLFVTTFPTEQPSWRRHPLAVVSLYLPAALLAAILISGGLIVGVRSAPWGYASVRAPSFLGFRVYLGLALPAILALLVYRMRGRQRPGHCGAAAHVASAGLALVGFGLLDLNVLQPLGLRSVRLFITPLGVVLMTAALTRATVRYRFLDIDTAVRKVSVHAVLLATLLIPCLSAILFVQRMTGSQPDALGTLIIAGTLVLAGFGFPRIKVAAQETLEQALFGQRRDLRQLLLRTSRDIATVLDVSRLVELVTECLKLTFHPREARLWTWDPSASTLMPAGARGGGAAAPPLLAHWLQTRSQVLSAHQARFGIDLEAAVAQELEGRGVEVLVPLHVKGRTIGILELGPRESGKFYGNDEIEALAGLGSQIAVALENARLAEDLARSAQLVERSSRLSTAGLLAAGVAHEIRNPLVAVRTFVDLLPERLDDPDFLTRFRALAQSEIDRITRLIDDLLSLGRSREQHWEEHSLNACVQRAVDLIRPQALTQDIAVHSEPAPDLPAVHIEPDQIHQVLLNLLLNAIDASPCRSTVTVRTWQEHRPEGERCLVEVSDQGSGIPADRLPNVFTPFFTTKRTGTGLGLSIAHHIITEHGGLIDIQSEEGRGTRVTISLPSASQLPATTPRHPAASAAHP